MKMFRMVKRSIRDSFKGFFRNFSLSLASIFCVVITLLLVSIAIILSANLNNFTKNIEKDLTIVVFMNKEATDAEIPILENQIKSMTNVSKYIFESKEDIKNKMMKENPTFESIMSSWDATTNPLQNTFSIKVKTIEDIGKTAEELKKLESVNIVKYGEGIVEQLISVFGIVRNITLGIVIALILVSAFLISNTIKITIYSRKTEIEIMRLVGSSNTAIKLPHLFEGLILGILGSIIPIIISIYGYIFVYNDLGGYLFSNMIELIKPTPFIFYVSLLLLIIGALVGMFGSTRAVRKHLKI